MRAIARGRPISCWRFRKRDGVIKPGQIVVDLGAAPGGWSQVAAIWSAVRARCSRSTCCLWNRYPGWNSSKAIFANAEALAVLEKPTTGRVDLVISDMAPNVTGMAAVDQPRSIYLCELALASPRPSLKPGGRLVAKIFQGEGFDGFVREVTRPVRSRSNPQTRRLARQESGGLFGGRELRFVVGLLNARHSCIRVALDKYSGALGCGVP